MFSLEKVLIFLTRKKCNCSFISQIYVRVKKKIILENKILEFKVTNTAITLMFDNSQK